MEISPTQPDTSTTTQSNSRITSDFDTFLRMLTAQIENQDPLNPIESSDFAVQLATFSSVEQQVQTNDLLRDLNGQFGASNIGQLADWVGREVRSAAPVFVDATPVTLFPKLASGAESAAVVVRNASGDEVGRFTIPTDGEPIAWAGVAADGSPFPPGRYSFEVQSFSAGDLIGTNPAETYRPVTEVRRGADGSAVIVLAGDTELIADDITALRAPS